MEEIRLPSWLREKHMPRGSKLITPGFVDKNLARIHSFMEELLHPEGSPSRRGLLQRLSPAARIAGVCVLVLSGVLLSKLWALFLLAIVATVMALLSGVNPLRLFTRRVMPPLLFTAIVLIPVIFSAFQPAERLFEVELLGYTLAVTRGGVELWQMLLLRVGVVLFLLSLLLRVTGEQELFSGLKALPVPAVVVTLVYMSFKQLSLFLKLAEDTNLARKSRTIRQDALKDEGQWFASRLSYFLKRVFSQSKEVSMAMVSRGFRGKVETLPAGACGLKDYIFLGFSFFVFFLSVGL